MAWFEISEGPDTMAISSHKVAARNHAEASAAALRGLAEAESVSTAKCYRVLDRLGMVVARGPKGGSTR